MRHTAGQIGPPRRRRTQDPARRWRRATRPCVWLLALLSALAPLLATGRAGASGAVTLSAVVNGAPLIVLYSRNLKATEDAVIAAGGTIVVPTFEFPGGRRFHFSDGAGNVLAVWSE